MPELRRPELAAGALALLLSGLHLLLAPSSGTDLSAQLAKASFARQHLLTPVDLSWYGGVHPFGYSLLAPGLMALLGVALCGVLAAVVSSVLFARLLRDLDRPWLSSLAGAFFWTADVASGRITFALGAMVGLLALVLLAHRGTALALAVLTALLSPVAAAFLGLVAAVLVLHRRPAGWSLGLASALPLLLLAAAFPGGGIQPFSADSSLPALLVALGVAWLTGESWLRTGALLYAAAVAFFGVHDDPFGSNVLRLGWLVAVSLLLATTARRSAPLVVLASVGLLAWQLDPVLDDLRAPQTSPLSAVTHELTALGAQRVEVVALRDHREAWQVAGVVPLARGWARQVDVRDNALLYRDHLDAGDYRRWLRERAVDHVVVPRHGQLDYGSTTEAGLLRRGLPGLSEQWQDHDWVVYAVAGHQPLADLPAQVVSSGAAALVLRSPAAATVVVRVRWSRWLSLTGPGCLSRHGGGVTVRFRQPGTVVLGSSLLPSGHC